MIKTNQAIIVIEGSLKGICVISNAMQFTNFCNEL